MNRSLSISLDGLRFCLALVVVVDHITQAIFSNGLPDYNPEASGAVALFFLLSGFVISYVTGKKEKTASDYAVARLSRLYSVIVPAILLSGLVWIVASITAPDFLLLHWTGRDQSLGSTPWIFAHPLLRFGMQSIASLTFLNQAQSHSIFPAVDTPIWSLGFEGPYYLFFGILLFTKGLRRIVLFLFSACIFGWVILGLFPAWLAGVALHRITSRLKLSARFSAPLGLFCLSAALLFAARFNTFLAWIAIHQHSTLLLLLDGRYFPGYHPSYSGLNHLFYYTVIAGSLLILGIHCLATQLEPVLLFVERPVRWLAAHTFSIYLYHYPLLVLLAAVTHYNHSSMAAVWIIFTIDLALCIALSVFTEGKKLWWRRHIRSVFHLFGKQAVSN
jgi:peptidoglycan/LPS O-acetylase OafA/YrhL